MNPPVSSVNGPILKMKPISKPFEALTYKSGLFTDKNRMFTDLICGSRKTLVLFASVKTKYVVRMIHKRILVFLIAFLPVIISACSDDDDDDLIGKWYRVSDMDGLARNYASSSRSVTKDI